MYIYNIHLAGGKTGYLSLNDPEIQIILGKIYKTYTQMNSES